MTGGLLAVAAVCAVLGAVWTRIARSLAHRQQILDRPDPRKVHREPVAYLGGMGVLLAFFGGVCLFPLVSPPVHLLHGPRLELILWGALAIFSVGLWDDLRGIPALGKLALQCLVGGAMWWGGVRIDVVPDALAAAYPAMAPGAWGGLAAGCAATILWYAMMMNSINLIDGLDGLAGGVSAIGALSIVGIASVAGLGNETILGALVAAATAGATAGFLVHNWHPAKIFLGDAGSLLLGFLLATAALTSSTKASTLQAMLVPLVALGLPIFETSFSFIRRAWSGTSPFKPDRRHLHHRLIDLGLSQTRVVGFLLFMTAFLGLNSVLLAQAGSKILLLNVAFLGAGLLLLIENLRYLETKRG